MKPTGNVIIKHGIVTLEKTMRFNQTCINWLITKTKSKDSTKWLDIEMPFIVEKVKGNLAVMPKAD